MCRGLQGYTARVDVALISTDTDAAAPVSSH